MENEIKPRKEREKYKISYRSVYEKNKKILDLLSEKPAPVKDNNLIHAKNIEGDMEVWFFGDMEYVIRHKSWSAKQSSPDIRLWKKVNGKLTERKAFKSVYRWDRSTLAEQMVADYLDKEFKTEHAKRSKRERNEIKIFKLREERDTLKALRMEKKKYGWFLAWRQYRHPLARLVKKGIIIEKYGGEYKLTRKKLK